MSKKRVLFITQEMGPYTALGDISAMLKRLPKHVQENGYEIRVLMPKFGTINERRHRLHEVVRLSGMNIIVDDDDFPLIIKVASFPGARMQVYFLDNEEFFSRKQIFEDTKGKRFDDNMERMVFFCKGVLETVKKFGWAPDIVSCHGWFTSLIPLYLKTVYKNEPIFENAKLLYTAYQDEFEGGDAEKFLRIAAINDLGGEDLQDYIHEDAINLQRGAILQSEMAVSGSEALADAVAGAMEGKENLPFSPLDDALADHLTFYNKILDQE